MKDNFKRLLSTLLAFFMVAASFTFTAFATDYPDISAVSSATISEIKVNNPLDYTVGEDIVFKFQLKRVLLSLRHHIFLTVPLWTTAER